LAVSLRIPASTYDQYMYLGRNGADQQARCVISFAGRINANQMAHAVRLTIDVEPVLSCRFVVRPWRPYWERRDDLDQIELLSVVKGAHLKDELWRFVTMPLDPFADPQVQASIFRSDRDTLCIKLNHVAADGEGVKQYAYLLATTYRKLTTDPSYRPEPNLRGSRCQVQIIKHLGLMTKARAFRRSISPWPVWGFPAVRGDLSDRAFVVRRVNPMRFGVIKEYGYQHQAPVNDIILTAFYRALFEIVDPPEGIPLPVQVPIDLRRYLSQGEASPIRNCLGALYPSITREPDEDFDDTLTRIQEVMKAIKADNPGLGEPLYLGLLFKLGFGGARRISDKIMERLIKSGKSHPFLSNLGIIDEQQLDFGDAEVTDAFVLSLVDYPPHFMLAVSTYRNTMTFTVGFCNAMAQRPLIERFFNLFESELPG